MASRKAFVSDAGHRVRLVYTPKHRSWLNQVEIWFSILARRVIRRGNLSSKEDLRAKILAFSNHANDVLAWPLRWTCTGQVLNVEQDSQYPGFGKRGNFPRSWKPDSVGYVPVRCWSNERGWRWLYWRKRSTRGSAKK